jgi:hypothetical protein
VTISVVAREKRRDKAQSVLANQMSAGGGPGSEVEMRATNPARRLYRPNIVCPCQLARHSKLSPPTAVFSTLSAFSNGFD